MIPGKQNTFGGDMKWKADLYTEKHDFVYDYGSALIDLLNPQQGEHILDLGCGTGQLTQEIHKRCGSVVGIDSSAEMIHSAKESFPEIDFQIADATDFHFKIPFDAIFSNAVLHWVIDAESAIRCMHQNLVNRGRIVLEFGGKGNVSTIISQINHTLEDFNYPPKAVNEQWFFPSISEYTTLLEDNGFDVLLANQFDRPTELASNATGILDWLNMFAAGFFIGVAESDVTEIMKTIQDRLKPTLLKNGKWYADYKRIRIVAKKQ